MKINWLHQKVTLWSGILLIMTVVFRTAAQNKPFALEIVRGSPRCLLPPVS